DPTSRLVRWRLKLAEYEYEVVFKAGKVNANADTLSRNPVSVLPLRVSEKSDSSESLFPAANTSERRKIRKHDAVCDNETEQTRLENSIKLTKTNKIPKTSTVDPSRDI
ncbi:hypothetical protein HN011_008013, partial [Eciton burchellii]